MENWIETKFWFLALISLVCICLGLVISHDLASAQSLSSAATSEIFTLNTTIEPITEPNSKIERMVAPASSTNLYLAGQAQSEIFTLNTTGFVKVPVSVPSNVPASIVTGQ